PTSTPTPTATPSATPTPSASPVATPRITVSAAATTVSPGGDATYTISASTINPSQVTAVNYLMGGKAILGSDYTLSGTIGGAEIFFAHMQRVIPAFDGVQKIRRIHLRANLSKQIERAKRIARALNEQNRRT